MLHIIPKLAFIHITVRTPVFLPFAETILDAIREFTRVGGTILPLISAKTMRFSIFILPCILITIRIDVCTLASLATIDPFTFKLVSILPLMDAIAVNFAIQPFTDI